MSSKRLKSNDTRSSRGSFLRNLRNLVGERSFLVVLRGVTRNAAKPISAACWYRMNAAGSTSPWSLSFHSPSPLVHSLSFSPAPSAVYVPLLSFSVSPISASLSPSLSGFHPLAPSYSRLFLWRGNPSMVARKPPAASLPCCFSAFPFISLPLLRSRFFLLSLFLTPFLLAARWLVHWFHRCIGPGSSYSFL